MKLSYKREYATLIQAGVLCQKVIVKAGMGHMADAGNVVMR